MRNILALLLALLAASAWAQQTPTLPGMPAGSISGTVTSTAGGPIEGATVLLIHPRLDGSADQPEPVTAFADGQGRFRFDDLEPGIYLVIATHPGYVFSASGSEGLPADKGRAMLLGPGQHEDLEISLKPNASISGRVLDGDGNPLEGYTATAERPAYVRGVQATIAGSSAVTDDRGVYLMEDLQPGRYFIRARRTQEVYGQYSLVIANKPGERDIRLGDTFYSSATDVSGASAVVIEAGRTIDGIDIKMLEREYFTVSGKVIGSDEAMATSRVLAAPAQVGGPASGSARLQADGSFILPGVPSGPGRVIYWHESAAPGGANTYGWTPIEVQGESLDNVSVDIRIQDITGVLRVEGERELDPLAADALKRISVHLRDVDGRNDRSVTPEADGSFTLSDVPRARYIADAGDFYGGPYLKEMRLGGVSILDTVLDLSDGFPAGSMEVVVSTDGGALRGTVRTKDGKAPGYATVTLVPATRLLGRRRLYPTGDADPGGSFEAAGIAPGRYEVFAWERIDDTAHWNEDFLRPFLTRGKVVEIEEGETEYLDLEIIPVDEMTEALARAGL